MKKIAHVNPNCTDATLCEPHGERGPVKMRINTDTDKEFMELVHECENAAYLVSEESHDEKELTQARENVLISLHRREQEVRKEVVREIWEGVHALERKYVRIPNEAYTIAFSEIIKLLTALSTTKTS